MIAEINDRSELEDRASKIWLQDELAVAWAKAGDVKSALAAADEIERDAGRAETLCRIAIVLADTNEQAAREVVLKAAKAVESIPDLDLSPDLDLPKVMARITLASAQARVGDLPAAKRAIEAIRAISRGDANGQAILSQAQAGVATALANRGDLDEAADVALPLPEGGLWRNAFQVVLAREAARRGNLPVARQALSAIPSGLHWVSAAAEMAQAQARGGDREGARQTLRLTSKVLEGERNPALRLLELEAVAEAQARMGDQDEAARTIAVMAASGEPALIKAANLARSWAALGLSQRLAAAREEAARSFQKARDLAALSQAQLERGHILEEIAAAEAEGGDVEDALGWARRTPTLECKIRAMLGAAEGLVKRRQFLAMPPKSDDSHAAKAPKPIDKKHPGTSQFSDEKQKDSPPPRTEEEAVELLLRNNAEVRITRDDKRPGKPVVEVVMFGHWVSPARLKLMAALKDLKVLNLSMSSVGDVGVKELAPLKSLHSLNLSYTRVRDAGLKELAPLKSLQSLDLSFTGVSGVGLKELASLKDLQSLHLAGIPLTDVGLKEVASLKNLKELYLGPGYVTDTLLKELAPLRALQTLDLSRTKVTDAGLKELAPLRALQTLDLSRTKVTDAGLKELAPLQALQSLYLVETAVTDAGLKELASLKDLKLLHLFGTEVTDAGLKEVASLKNLKELYVTGRKVTDIGLRELASLRALRKLHLYEAKVTSAGLKELASLENLEVLELFGCTVTDEGLMELSPLRSLKELRLGGTMVTRAGIHELQKALPNCKING
jgi:hypothetical protein